jgi:hypothetical protein
MSSGFTTASRGIGVTLVAEVATALPELFRAQIEPLNAG